MADTPPLKRCFVIGPIGDAGSADRKRSDQVLKHVFVRAAESCGYGVPVRADQISDPGVITRQIVEHLLEDELVLADLTGRNANVFYELAIRHAVFKPVVQLIKDGETIPFDVAVMRTVSLDLQDPDSVVAARDEVIKQIRAVEKDASQVDSPLSTAIDVLEARKGGRPELAKILEELGKFNEGVARLPQEIAFRQNQFAGPLGVLTSTSAPGAGWTPVGPQGAQGTQAWTPLAWTPPGVTFTRHPATGEVLMGTPLPLRTPVPPPPGPGKPPGKPKGKT